MASPFLWSTLLLVTLLYYLVVDAKLPFYNRKYCGRITRYRSFTMTDEETKKSGHVILLAPWAVTIHIGSGSGSSKVICGGTLITNKHVLTAAHCFRKEFVAIKNNKYSNRYCEPNQRFTDEEILNTTLVRVGAVCNAKDAHAGCTEDKALGKLVKIKRFGLEKFFETNCENGHDLMIIELNESVEKVEAVNHICLPFVQKFKIPDGINVTSFGWGSDPGKAYDNEPYPMIQILDLESTPFDECVDKWGQPIPDDSYCTKEEEEKNVCSGDSGGGITFRPKSSWRQYIVGVVSYGTDCSKLLLGAEPRAQINTDVRKYEKFILNFINGS